MQGMKEDADYLCDDAFLRKEQYHRNWAQMFMEERRADPECQPKQRGEDHIQGLALRTRGWESGEERPGREDGLPFRETWLKGRRGDN